jgi:hypothetical protein
VTNAANLALWAPTARRKGWVEGTMRPLRAARQFPGLRSRAFAAGRTHRADPSMPIGVGQFLRAAQRCKRRRCDAIPGSRTARKGRASRMDQPVPCLNYEWFMPCNLLLGLTLHLVVVAGWRRTEREQGGVKADATPRCG